MNINEKRSNNDDTITTTVSINERRSNNDDIITTTVNISESNSTVMMVPSYKRQLLQTHRKRTAINIKKDLKTAPNGVKIQTLFASVI